MKKETKAIPLDAVPQKALSVKAQKTLLLSTSILFATIVAVLGIALVVNYCNNVSLKAKEAAVIDQYNKVAKEHENLVDPDYASIYFDGNNVYIPSDDIIIEYK